MDFPTAQDPRTCVIFIGFCPPYVLKGRAEDAHWFMALMTVSTMCRHSILHQQFKYALYKISKKKKRN